MENISSITHGMGYADALQRWDSQGIIRQAMRIISINGRLGAGLVLRAVTMMMALGAIVVGILNISVLLLLAGLLVFSVNIVARGAGR